MDLTSFEPSRTLPARIPSALRFFVGEWMLEVGVGFPIKRARHLAASSVRPMVPFQSNGRLASHLLHLSSKRTFLLLACTSGREQNTQILTSPIVRLSQVRLLDQSWVLQDHCVSSIRLRLQTSGCRVAPISRTHSLGRSRGVTFATATSNIRTDQIT